MKKLPKELLNSKYRKEMYKKAEDIMKKLENILPVSSVYLLGSFTTKKRRPADVDFMILLKTKENKKNSKWAVDLALVPDNRYGDSVLKDTRKWMKQKYGSKKTEVIKLK